MVVHLYECACSPPDVTGPLADGPHTFEVYAVDAVGNVDPTPATFNWDVDNSDPETTIDSATVPSGGSGTSISDGDDTAETSIRFTFSGTDTGTGATGVDHFVCTVDGGTPVDPCTSPFDVTGPLADGPHTFEVYAVDAVGNVDPTPATFNWDVDNSDPETTIDSATVPSGGSGTSISDGDDTAETSIRFTFSGTDTGTGATGVDHFVCTVDGGTPVDPCTSPFDVTGPLADGPHTFEVYAVDAVGNVDPTPATFNWDVDNSDPETTIDSATVPSGGSGTSISDGDDTAETSIRFTFSGTDTGTGATGVDHFVCTVDGGTPVDICTSPFDVTGPLADGPHTFEVYAVDAVGNVDPTPATFNWDVDNSDPETTIDSATVPSGGSGTSISDGDDTAETSIRFTFSGTDTGTGATGVDHFVCTVDGGTPVDPCTSPFDIAGPLADGPHTFEVYAVDAVGNVDPTPATFNWDVDNSDPETTIDSATVPSGGSGTSISDGDDTAETSIRFTFSGTDTGTGATGVDHFVCTVDGGTPVDPCIHHLMLQVHWQMAHIHLKSMQWML